MRRLTRTEYNNTVHDLLGETGQPAERFAPDESTGILLSNTGASVSRLLLQQYQDAAESLAERAVADLSKLLPCNPAATGEDACALEFIRSFGRRAFRRSLEADEVEALRRLYANVHADVPEKPDFRTRIRVVLQVLLQSPSFLYRVESGRAVAGRADLVTLDDDTLASRLSYFLGATTPDGQLLDAAGAKKLSTPAGLEEQARRLLAQPQLGAAVESLHEQWLGLDGLATLTKDKAVYSAFGNTLRDAMAQETRLFTRHVVVEGDAKLETLLTAPITFITSPLASIYGVKLPSGATAPVKVDLPPEQRAGLLTQASFLAVHSNENQSSPIKRGVAVRERLLCQEAPPPPPNTNVEPPIPSKDATTRERFAQHTRDPACAGCHRLFDPIGFGLEAYDGIGKFRATENGRAVDVQGELVDAGNASGAFKGGRELAARLAQSDQVRNCAVNVWVEMALGRPTGPEDACPIAPIRDAFAASRGDVRHMLLAIVKSDLFRTGGKTP